MTSSPHSTPIGAMLTPPPAAIVVTIVSTITIRTGRRLARRTLRQLHAIGARIVGRREIAPRERAFLPVRLAERHREARARELAAEIERVRRLDDVELGEELRDARRIGRADEPLAVQHRDPLAIGEDAEVGIGDLRLERRSEEHTSELQSPCNL